ncbi:MAG: cobalamin biosynthesis protein CobW [Lachnospiraceae bacterium]|nr:cobalamin biosynthesis protein CobW [Lachnospiraceae bacterium]
MTKIDIFSGFLGAGKTTLIKKLLKEAMDASKVVLIENEFGEIGIDGGFLKEAGVEIKEMNSGCICCSLVGDFGTSLAEVLDKYHPERILIEPSGVGKLSDVMKAVQNVKSDVDVQLNSAVVVVDANKCKMYAKNFGEFFLNQIEHAGTIILSRTADISESKLNAALEIIREHNSKATVITTPWDELDGKKILETIENAKDLEAELMEEVAKLHDEHEHHHHDHGEDCTCGCHDHDGDEDEHEHHHHDHDEDEHEHHHHDHEEHHHDHEEEHNHGHHHDHDDHDENCTCGCHDHDHEHHHHHHADEIFTSWGMETPTAYTKDEIETILKKLDDADTYGVILRAKGMLPSNDGTWINFDYVPEESNVRTGAPEVTGKICVIGSKLNEDNLKALFTK